MSSCTALQAGREEKILSPQCLLCIDLCAEREIAALAYRQAGL